MSKPAKGSTGDGYNLGGLVYTGARKLLGAATSAAVAAASAVASGAWGVASADKGAQGSSKQRYSMAGHVSCAGHECCVCYSTTSNPVFCQCAQCVCALCFDRLTSSPKVCPVCRDPYIGEDEAVRRAQACSAPAPLWPPARKAAEVKKPSKPKKRSGQPFSTATTTTPQKRRKFNTAKPAKPVSKTDRRGPESRVQVHTQCSAFLRGNQSVRCRNRVASYHERYCGVHTGLTQAHAKLLMVAHK